jgi:hypothetical protein
MLFTLAVIFLVLWVLGFSVFHLAGALIHVLLIVAIIVVLIRIIRGK